MAVLQRDLTRGDPQKHIIAFSIPLIQAMLFQALYNAVDLFFAGRFLGLEGQAAVSVCGPVMNVFMRTVAGMSLGVNLLVGRRKGSGDLEYTLRGANTAISIYAIGAAVISVLGVLTAPWILRLVRTPAEAMPAATAYLRIVFLGSVFTMGYSLINAFQRGFGDARSSLYFVMVSTLVNIALDYVLLAFTGLQAAGLAIATVTAQAVSFLMGVAYFRINKHVIDFRLSSLRLHRGDALELLSLGIPSAVQYLLINAAKLTLTGIANSFGTVAAVAYGIGLKIDSFASLPHQAMEESTLAFASQNFGIGDETRAVEGRKASVRISLCISLFMMTVIFAFAPQLAGIFTTDDEVLAQAVLFLRCVVPMYLASALARTPSGFVRASGNTIFPVFQTLLGQYVTRIPVAFFCAYVLDMGLAGVAVAWIAAPTVSAIAYGVYIHTGLWRRSWKRMKAPDKA